MSGGEKGVMLKDFVHVEQTYVFQPFHSQGSSFIAQINKRLHYQAYFPSISPHPQILADQILLPPILHFKWQTSPTLFPLFLT